MEDLILYREFLLIWQLQSRGRSSGEEFRGQGVPGTGYLIIRNVEWRQVVSH